MVIIFKTVFIIFARVRH